jgi:predicted SAM-dependent methyltransferase
MLGKIERVLRPKLGVVRSRLRRLSTPSQISRFDRLHLGCGPRHIDGWANIDLYGHDNIIWDLTKPLPMKRDAVRFVYSEHFIEHITRADAKTILTHCRNVMAKGGVVRISTPDLKGCIAAYQQGILVNMPDYNWQPRSLCEMMNDNMRAWGHQYVYDEPEMFDLLRECGFSTVKRVEWHQSDSPELRGLETRPNQGDLIVEAVV